MMRVLVAGLGDIARKAYLPILAATPNLELHLATRNAAAVQELGASYRLTNRHPSIEDALTSATFDAAFVHAATVAHRPMVETLLRAGIPTFVDKPLADNLADATDLVSLAENTGCLLMVGFNRRFAPDYAGLRDQPHDLCVMHKNRKRLLAAPRVTVFDDFIHVVDTLLFLAQSPIERVTIETIVREDRLIAVTLMLAGDGYQAIGTMHRDSGLDEERLELFGGGRMRAVLNLSDRRELVGGKDIRTRRPDWSSVARQRGFEAMCADFLQGVRDRRPTASREILETHRICEMIVEHAERTRG